MAEIKFCGLTRAEDVRAAVANRAAYVGVIFAGGPRRISVDHARQILADVPPAVKRVGVFADQSDDDIAHAVSAAGLNVVQLHTGGGANRNQALRARTGAQIWPVLRLADASLPDDSVLRDLLDGADALMLDALAPAQAGGASAGAARPLGGTGIALPWADLAERVAPWRATRHLVLAGGLRPENVRAAIDALSPDVVDVSSGIEAAPGIKDHDRMRAFCDAVHGAPAPLRRTVHMQAVSNH